MKAMIFAAGLGTRLKPFTESHPKALLPLAGKTLLQWQIERLKAAGITDIVVNIHHFGQQIIDYLQQNNGFGCTIQISDERDALLETGGGLLKAAALLGNNEPVLVCNVDILSNIAVRDLIAAHEASRGTCTDRTDQTERERNRLLASVVVSDRETQRYLLFSDNGELRGWTNIKTGEVRPEGFRLSTFDFRLLAFSGMQIVEPAFFRELRYTQAEKGDKFSLIDAYLSIVTRQAGVIRAYVPKQYKMMDVGKIDQLAEAERFAATLG